MLHTLGSTLEACACSLGLPLYSEHYLRDLRPPSLHEDHHHLRGEDGPGFAAGSKAAADDDALDPMEGTSRGAGCSSQQVDPQVEASSAAIPPGGQEAGEVTASWQLLPPPDIFLVLLGLLKGSGVPSPDELPVLMSPPHIDTVASYITARTRDMIECFTRLTDGANR